MKRWMGILFFLIICLSTNARVLETIDAVVNGELILSGEVNYRVLDKADELNLFVMENNQRTIPPDVYQELRTQVLGKMIDELLLIQAVRNKLKPQDFAAIREDAQRKADAYMELLRASSRLQQEEQRFNMTWEEIRQANYQKSYNENIQRVIINQIINQDVKAPTQEELNEYQKQHADDPPTGDIKVQQLQLSAPPTLGPEDEARVSQKAREIVLRARGGESFERLIFINNRQQAQETTLQKGKILPVFDPVFDLNVGDISDPIRTTNAYIIMRVTAKDTLEARVLNIKKRKKSEEWLNQLREDAKIELKTSQSASTASQ